MINVSGEKTVTCPITGGKGKKMDKASFLALCESKQGQTFRGLFIYKQCRECQGKTIPAELTITREEEEVARDREKKACELCGQVKQLSTHYDKLVCSSCCVVQGVVRNRPDSVFACIRDCHDITEYLTGEEKHRVVINSGEQHGQTVVHADIEELKTIKQANDSLKKIIHNLALGNVELEAHLDDKSFVLGRAREDLQKTELQQRKTIADQQEKIADFSNQVDKLRQLTTGKDFQTSALMTENNQLKKEISLLKANIKNTGYDKDKVMTVLVDIAQAHIDGRLTVKSEHFKELRKAATA